MKPPLLTLQLRRGSKVIPQFPVKRLVPCIREGRLLPGDEISPDGRRWLRLDQYPQLVRYFRGGPAQPKSREPLAAADGGPAPSAALPPNMKDTLENLADMLNDLNR